MRAAELAPVAEKWIRENIIVCLTGWNHFDGAHEQSDAWLSLRVPGAHPGGKALEPSRGKRIARGEVRRRPFEERRIIILFRKVFASESSGDVGIESARLGIRPRFGESCLEQGEEAGGLGFVR